MADQKGKRTKSRKQQILEFYAKCKEEDVRDLKQQLESMGERVDSRLQGEHLFLYFTERKTLAARLCAAAHQH